MTSEELLHFYREGAGVSANEAASEIYDRYAARLAALATERIGPRLRRRFDADDVVQSAFRSFFVGAAADRYELGGPGDLWRLLAGITLNKLYGQIEKQTAAKRSPKREAYESHSLAQPLAPEPAASEIAAAEESLQTAIADLTPQEQELFASLVEGRSPEAIGELLGKSPRTVRRLLASVRQKIEARLLTDDKEGGAPALLGYEDIVLEELLGAGGMGKVFRARLKNSGKLVAVKALLKSRQTDRRAVLRFVQEARLLSRLHHPHIVGVRGLGRFPGGGYFLALDLVEGVDLEKRLARGPLPPEEMLRIARAVASAMTHVHDRGIVHSDLKPANVLLAKSGGVYVTDFGFACLLAADQSIPGVGGTAGFIAPEVLSGESPPTLASDIYSFGALLTRMSNSQEPQEFSIAMEKIAKRCLATRPSDRFATFGDVIAAMQSLKLSRRSSRTRRD